MKRQQSKCKTMKESESNKGFFRYEVLIGIVGFMLTCHNGLFSMTFIFVLHTPNYTCNESVPVMMNESTTEADECKYKTHNNATAKCEYWIFEEETGVSSVVTEFNLVCQLSWVKPFVISTVMCGVLVGSIFGGVISDRIGRKKLAIGSCMVYATAQIVLGCSQSVEMFLVTYFVIGIGGILQYMSAYMLIVETVSDSFHSTSAMMLNMGYSTGYMVVPLLAYLIPSWRNLYIVIGIYGVCLIPILCIISESPLWLLTANRTMDAKKILRKVYKIDKSSPELEELISIKTRNTDAKLSIKSLLSLVTITSFRRRSIIVYLMWFSVSLTYYCISFNTSNMGGNRFINCLIAGAVEIPAILSFLWSIQKFGRRSTLVTTLLVAGITCAVLPYLGLYSTTAMITSAMISKFMATGVFFTVYLYVAELFPTCLRNSSLGIASAFARIGSIVGSFLFISGKPIAYLVIGLLSINCAFTCLLLPETKGVPLPNTEAEAIALDKYNLKFCCSRKPQKQDEW